MMDDRLFVQFLLEGHESLLYEAEVRLVAIVLPFAALFFFFLKGLFSPSLLSLSEFSQPLSFLDLYVSLGLLLNFLRYKTGRENTRMSCDIFNAKSKSESGIYELFL